MAVVSDIGPAVGGALLVGDPGYASARGRVHVYAGSPELDSIPDYSLEGEAPGDLFGASVCDAGDFNGDGLHDLAIGAPGRSSGTGRVYVYFGAESFPTSPDLVLDGTEPRQLFGSALTHAIPPSSTTHSHLVVGAPGGYSGRGEVFVFAGADTPSTAPILVRQDPGATFIGPYTERARWGSSLAFGDVRGDARNELVVGGPGAMQGRGRYEVFDYEDYGIYTMGSRVYGTVPYGHLGTALAIAPVGAGGAKLIAAGQPGANAGRGTVELYDGEAGFGAFPQLSLSGDRADDAFGSSLAVGRVLDSAPDPVLIIGAPLADARAANGGAAYWYSMPDAVDVNSVLLSLKVDGSDLLEGGYTSGSPSFRLRMESGEMIDAARSRIELDGERLVISSLEGSELVVEPGALAEGRHRIAVRLVSSLGSSAGELTRSFVVTHKLRILGTRLGPSPTRGPATLRFEMSRPAAFEVDVFDAQGRRVHHSGPIRGIAGANELALDAATERWSPGLYFYVLTARHAGSIDRASGRIVLAR